MVTAIIISTQDENKILPNAIPRRRNEQKGEAQTQ
jgi:hypothetical protein